jgi:2-amino-4-hydroxy-6-hydroxymethyldihydropteridine diphosphokinase
MNEIAYLSLGSNLGNREQNLQQAIRRAKASGRIVAVSSFYETEPVEFTDQPCFLNCVIALETTADSAQLMRELLRIENEMGRKRTVKKGPRSIDIDILLFGDAVVNTPELTIPHPEMTPELLHPVSQKAIKELLAELAPGQRVQKYQRGIRAE